MKRIILYIGILALVIAVPVKPINIGQLRPIQAVSVYREHDWIVIETDTGDKGIGGTVQQALQNLKDTTAGIIYLDTAEYLLLRRDTLDTVEILRDYLKPAVKLCVTAKETDLPQTVKFLDAQGKLPKLRVWKKGAELPVLGTFGDSFIFLKKVENNA